MRKIRNNTKTIDRPKKSLGQNFLSDPKILRKIVDEAEIKKEDTVLEIGPGRGSLTEILLERAKKVIAIEKDEELAEYLKNKFKKEVKDRKLEIIVGDILEIENLLKIAKLEIRNYILVGNIPYYITGEIFRKFLESDRQPESITFVIQKEVAERIMARDGKESILSISIKAFGEPHYGGIIKSGSFFPKPKVDSAIISIRNINKKNFSSKILDDKFFEIVKNGFAHKRKLLIRNLNLDNKIFENIGLPLKIRAENMKLEDWIKLLRELG